MKNLLKMGDLSPAELTHILDVADQLKADCKAGRTAPLLRKYHKPHRPAGRQNRNVHPHSGCGPCGAKQSLSRRKSVITPSSDGSYLPSIFIPFHRIL